jgi:hypothetical protein
MPDDLSTTNPSNIIDAAGRFDGGIRGRARFDNDGTPRFNAIPEVDFDWTNQEWALTHAPVCRLASHVLRHDDRQLEQMLRAVHDEGGLEEYVDLLERTQRSPYRWPELAGGINAIVP